MDGGVMDGGDADHELSDGDVEDAEVRDADEGDADFEEEPLPPFLTITGRREVPPDDVEYRVYRLEAADWTVPYDISHALEELSPQPIDGNDEYLNISPDGQWLTLLTSRFDPDCAGWPCLAVVAADLGDGDAIFAGGDMVHPSGMPAVASGGDLVIYPDASADDRWDLFAVTRDGRRWSDPLLLTAESPYPFQSHPAISGDGERVVFVCTPQIYSGPGTAICEVRADGTDFRVVLAPEDGPGGTASNELASPDYAPDESIVFEADWGDEMLIWRLLPGETEPFEVNPRLDHDTSPCVLADGRIASYFWDDGSEQIVIKVMTADGDDHFLIEVEIELDLVEFGLGCGGP